MIKNISFWGWYAIITVGLFAIFNPTGYSIWHLRFRDERYQKKKQNYIKNLIEKKHG